MKWMELLVLRMLVQSIHCEWELLISKLMDSSTFSDWRNADNSLGSNLISVCDLPSDLNTKLLQGDTILTRSIPIPGPRALSKIRLSFDIYYLNLWNSAETISVYANSLLVYFERPNLCTSLDFPIRYCNARHPGKSYEEKFQHVDYEMAFNDPNLFIEIFHDRKSSGTTSEYGLANFIVQIFYCDDLCEECDEYNCLTCKLGYELFRGKCVCNELNQFSFYNPNLNCVEQCPINYMPDNNRICQAATSALLFEDLTSNTFSSYNFNFIPDKYFSSYQLMIYEIDSKSVAGMFGNTDIIYYNNLDLPQNNFYVLSFEIAITGLLQKIQGEKIIISINDLETITLVDYQQILFTSSIQLMQNVQNAVSCTAVSFKYCRKQQVSLYFYVTEKITSISFSTKFTLNTASRKWAIRDLKIEQYQITTTLNYCSGNCFTCSQSDNKFCLSCTGIFKLYNNNCVQTCPTFTTTVGNVCSDPDIINNQQYLTNMLYDLSYQDTSDFSLKTTQYFMGKYILGGYEVWSDQQILHQLKSDKPFYKVKILFNIVFIDSTNSMIQFRTSVNNEVAQYTAFNGVSVGNQVGQYSLAEYVQNVEYTKQFTSTSQINVQLQCINGIDDQAYCGIYDYRVIIFTCQENCLECDENGLCTNPINTIDKDINGCKIGYYQLKDACYACQKGCLECTDSIVCQNCQLGYELRNNVCYCSQLKQVSEYCEQSNCFHNCQTCLNDQRPYYNRAPTNCLSCDENKHLWLNVNQCQCLDGYYMENFSCYICYPTCQKCLNKARVCTQCFNNQNRELKSDNCNCKEGYFQEDNDLVCQKCDDLCKICSFTKTQCKSCYSQHNRRLMNDTCICMDGYYDVGELVCQQCNSKCKTCQNSSTCTSCDDTQFRMLSQSNTCVCKSNYYEQSSSVTCGKCHFSCSECKQDNQYSSCTKCPQTREPFFNQQNNNNLFTCKCRRGYYESNNYECNSCLDYVNPPINHYCYSFCGDGIVQWNEDCDDGNNIQRDNCYKCLKSDSFCLDYTCTGCLAGQCTGCIDGFYLTSDYICKPCDSSCKTCVSKQDKCTDCIIYKQDGSGCLMCDINLGYHIINNQCISICGDGIRTDQEECDDGNLDINDGCNNNCLIESNYQCDTICQLIIYPLLKFELNPFDKLFDSQRIIRIKTDTLVSITGNINSIFQFKINNSNQYEINLIDLTSYSEQYTQLFLELTINFLQPVESPELLCQILNQESIFNQQGFTFEEKNYAVSLLQYNPPNSSTQDATDGLMQLSKYVLYLLLGLAILAFLFGGLNIFWNLLDALQLISYLQFFNVDYPYNVNNYFTIFGFAQFDFLKQYFDLETIISQYVNTPDADPKFREQGYSTVFYVNIITVFTVFTTTLLTFIACKMLLSTLTRISHSFIYVPIEHQEQSVCTFFIYRVTRNLQISLLQINQQFMSGVIRTFMAVAFDYNLAVFLQLKDLDLNDPILFTSFLVCLMAIIIEMIFLLFSINFMSKPQYVFKQKAIQNNFGAIYEGVKLLKNPFPYYFNIILLIKKILFMMVLVMFYSSPCFQIGFASLLNIVMTLYLIKSKPLEDKDEQFKQIGSEIIIWFAELFILGLAIDQETNNLQEIGRLNIGWCIIGITSSLILFQLVIDIKQHGQFLIKEYSIIRKLIDRFKLYLNKQEPQQESNIFLKGRRRLGIENLTTTQGNIFTTKNYTNKTLMSNYKTGKVMTFTLSSSSS